MAEKEKNSTQLTWLSLYSWETGLKIQVLYLQSLCI